MCDVMCGDVMCDDVMCVMSCVMMSCVMMSCVVMSCVMMSCVVMSCVVMSCMVMSCNQPSPPMCHPSVYIPDISYMYMTSLYMTSLYMMSGEIFQTFPSYVHTEYVHMKEEGLQTSNTWKVQGRRSRSGRSGGHRTNIRPTNPRKNAIQALAGCSIVALKVAMLEGTSDDSCRPQDFCWAWRKADFVVRRKSPSKSKFGKLRSQ